MGFSSETMEAWAPQFSRENWDENDRGKLDEKLRYDIIPFIVTEDRLQRRKLSTGGPILRLLDAYDCQQTQ